jgi:hypothetical protein
MVRWTKELEDKVARNLEIEREFRVKQAVLEINEWVAETLAERPELTADEIYSDVVSAYLEAEIGPGDKKLRDAISMATRGWV